MWGEEGEYNAASILPTVYVVDPLPTYTQFTTNWLKELSIMNTTSPPYQYICSNKLWITWGTDDRPSALCFSLISATLAARDSDLAPPLALGVVGVALVFGRSPLVVE